MCIMEVRPGQHHSTIAQAQAHNVNTVVSDLELFSTLLRSTNETEMLEQVDEIHADLESLYERLLSLWGLFLTRECGDIETFTPEGHSHDVNEAIRDFIERRIHEDKHRARQYETR